MHTSDLWTQILFYSFGHLSKLSLYKPQTPYNFMVRSSEGTPN
jgi:hypothetical protein